MANKNIALTDNILGNITCSNLAPNNSTVFLGTTPRPWGNIVATTVTANVSGSVTGNLFGVATTATTATSASFATSAASASLARTASFIGTNVSFTIITASSALLIGTRADNSASLYISGSKTNRHIIEIDRYDGAEVFILNNSGSIVTPLMFPSASVNFGTKISYNPPITFGNLQDETIWVETSPVSSSGKNLTIQAGSTTNYSSTSFIALGQTSRQWMTMAAHWNGNIYAAASSQIYMQTSGSGIFNSLSQSGAGSITLLGGMCVSKAGNVYSMVSNSDIFMQTSGSGNFVSQSQGTLAWRGAAANILSGDVYACVYALGNIYKQTLGEGNFVALPTSSAPAANWSAMGSDPNGNVYAYELNVDVWKLAYGDTIFKRMNIPSLYSLSGLGVRGIAGDGYGNLYLTTPANAGNDIYFLPENAVDVVHLNAQSIFWGPICIDPIGRVYAGNYNNGDIYVRAFALGPEDLNGGNLILSSGKGKGAGTSSISFYTGTTTTSSAVIQSTSEKMTLIGNGNLGIGTTDPFNRLDVVGNISCSVITASLFGAATAVPYSSSVNAITTPVRTGSMYLGENGDLLYIYNGTTWKSCSLF